MIRIVLIFVVFVSQLFTNQVLSANGKCPRQLDKVEEGRKCRKSCEKDNDCKGANKGCHCDNVCGMSCFNIKSECPPPPPFENGHIDFDSNLYGATARYECNDGYIRFGESTRTCQSDKKWSGTIPTCEVGCSKPPQHRAAFTLADGNGFSVGTKVTYICRFGFTLVGDSDLECFSNFTWSEPQFECVKVSCGNPEKPINGYLEGDDFSFGSWVTYFCEKGYVIDEPRQIRRHCSTTGKWSGEPRTCSKIKCDMPKGPEKGFVDVSDLSLEFKSLVNYNCDFGYILIGSSKGECNEEGNWGDVPICTVDVNCNFDGVANPLCGYSNIGDGSWGREFEQENTVSGNPSYVLRASSAPAILRSPVIPSAGPYCFKFHYYISLVFNDDSLTIMIQNGREKVGGVWPKERIRKWHKQQITMQPMTIFGGIQYDIKLNDGSTQVDFDDFLLQEGACSSNCPPETCLNGGTCIDRVDKFVCLCDRFHTGRNCEKVITCPDLPPLKHGSPVISPDPSVLRVDTKVEFFCSKGYRLIGPKETTCKEDGKWSRNQRTTCKEILCGKPAPNPGGSMIVDNERLTIGTVVTYICPLGTVLLGKDPVIVCGRTGKWSGGGQGGCSKQNPRLTTTGCPKGYRTIDMMCYKAFESRRTRFFDALALCRVDGASLAIVRSREERQRLEKIAKQGYLHHVGLTDVGRRNMIWLDGENFEKIASELYTGDFTERNDITSRPRCSAFLRFSGVTSIISSSCAMERRFICQTFSRSIVPVEIISDDLENLGKINGVYRPIMGLGYNGGIVYKQQSNRSLYLFRTDSSGWSIGDYNVMKTRPVKEKDLVNTISTAAVPQNVIEEWKIGSGVQTRMGDVADISIGIYDLWTSWSTWGPCTKTCGTGSQTKLRTCIQEGGSPGYGDCKGRSFMARACNTKQCIITRWGDWGDWNRCSKPCGGGSRTRNRSCIKDPESSENCVGHDEEPEICHLQDCKPETSNWKRHKTLEYQIVYGLGTQSDAQGKCALKSGKIATVDNSGVHEFLAEMVDNVHCKSQSAYSEWKLWVTNAISGERENTTDNPSVKKTDTSNATDDQCDVAVHSCGSINLTWSQVECNYPAMSGDVCERVWRPCNRNPCGNGGECTNVIEETYRCDCFDNYQGDDCETEIKCSVEDLKKRFTVSYAADMEAVDEAAVAKGVQIHLACRGKSQGTSDRQIYRCLGLEQWDAKRDPEIDCGNTCSLPLKFGRSVIAKHENIIVKGGDTFPLLTLLTFQCPEFMELAGEPSAECTEYGWDVELPEECEFAYPCDKPKIPENGELEILPRFQKEFLKSGTRITLRCKDNYASMGESKIECGKDGRWTGSLGNCTNKTGCELDLQKFHEDAEALNSEYVGIEKNTIFKVGQTVFILCNRGQGTLREFKCTSLTGWRPGIWSYCQ